MSHKPKDSSESLLINNAKNIHFGILVFGFLLFIVGIIVVAIKPQLEGFVLKLVLGLAGLAFGSVWIRRKNQ